MGIWQFLGLYIVYAFISIGLFFATTLPGMLGLIIIGFGIPYYIALGLVILIATLIRWNNKKFRISYSLALLLLMVALQIITILSNISGGSSMGFYASCSPYQNFIQHLLAPLPEGVNCLNSPWIDWRLLISFYLLYSISSVLFWLRAVFSSNVN